MLAVVIRLEIMKSPHLTFSFERKISNNNKNWQAIQAEGQWSRPKSISASTETGTWGQIQWSARLSRLSKTTGQMYKEGEEQLAILINFSFFLPRHTKNNSY